MNRDHCPQPPLQLVPFEPLPPGLNLALTAICRRPGAGERLQLHYRLSGDLDAVVIPSPKGTARRLDGLWQSTCLECFLARPEAANYWEFNFSPNGDWNVYQLQAYRDGLLADPQYASLTPQIQRCSDVLEMELEIPLPQCLLKAPQLELAICAVIAIKDGSSSYWALRHCGVEADFHCRDSFMVRL